MLIKKLFTLVIPGALFLLTACTTISDETTEGGAVVEDRTGTDAGHGENTDAYEGQTGAYNDSAMAEGSAIEGASSAEALSDPNSPLSVRTLYFAYNSTTINEQGQSVLNAHAEYLSLNPDKILIIEGHTDERGTREYNLALGERRSRSIADFLSASGVSQQQLEVRSFGEENPAALDHNESAWQLNRRVELLY